MSLVLEEIDYDDYLFSYHIAPTINRINRV